MLAILSECNIIIFILNLFFSHRIIEQQDIKVIKLKY